MKRIKWHICLLALSVVLSSQPVWAQEIASDKVNEVLDESIIGEEFETDETVEEQLPVEDVFEENPIEEILPEDDVLENELTDSEDVTTEEVIEESEDVVEEESEEESEEVQDTFHDLQEVSVAQGYYQISPASNSGLSFDIASASDSAGANVQIHKDNNTFAQCFYIAPKSNGWYTIQSMSSKMMIGVANYPSEIRENVLQDTYSGDVNQEFKFYKTSDGGVVIRCNAGENLVLDIADGKIQKGGNLQLYRYNGTAAQKFALYSWELPGTEVDIEEAVYRIYPASAPGVTLDVSGGSIEKEANIQIYRVNDTIAQEWKIVKEGTWYRIISEKSGLCLDIAGGSAKKGTNIQQYTLNTRHGQQYRFYETKEGQYCIMSRLGTVLDCAQGSFESSTNVQAYTSNGTAAQRWSLKEILVPNKSVTYMNEGYYSIQNAGTKALIEDTEIFAVEEQKDGWYMLKSMGNGMYLEVKDASSGNGAELQFSEKNKVDAQKFKFFDAGNGQYYIKGKVTTFVTSQESGMTVMNEAVCTSDQKWMVNAVLPDAVEIGIEEDDYNIRSAHGTAFVFDVSSASTEDQGNIQLYNFNGTAAQSFHIKEDDDGWYTIRANCSNLYLDVEGQSGEAGANLWQMSESDNDGQKFKFYQMADGKIIIKSKLGTVIETVEASKKANIQMDYLDYTTGQKWTLSKARGYVRDSKYYPFVDEIILPSGGYDVYTLNIGLKVIEINKKLLGTTSASFTSKTVSAVKAFQRQKGLLDTGIVNKATWLAMGLTEDAWYNLGTYRTPMGVNEDSLKQEYIDVMLRVAKEYADAGTEYRIGCSGVPGTYADCSGLIYQCLYAIGINPDLNIVDHALAEYEYCSYYMAKDAKLGATVDKKNIKAGDLVFYCNAGGGSVCHIAIYAGNNKIYDAWPGIGVTKRSINISGYSVCKVMRVII